jgi:hypothetical protein
LTRALAQTGHAHGSLGKSAAAGLLHHGGHRLLFVQLWHASILKRGDLILHHPKQQRRRNFVHRNVIGRVVFGLNSGVQRGRVVVIQRLIFRGRPINIRSGQQLLQRRVSRGHRVRQHVPLPF